MRHPVPATLPGPGPVPATAPAGNERREAATIGCGCYLYRLYRRTDLDAMVLHERTTINALLAPPRRVDESATDLALGGPHRF
jgi:hypothetical protein